MRKVLTRSLLIGQLLYMYSNGMAAQAPIADSVRLSLQQAEKTFIDSNWVLLAANYHIDAQKALIDQAKRWDNPVLITDQNIFSNNRFMEHGKDPVTGYPTGQYFIQVQQLIKTAGKRSKLVNIATTNARISELQFTDVMRTLRFQLRTDYYQLVQQLSNWRILLGQLAQVDNLYVQMEKQLLAGNIAQKDLLRIRALVIGLQQDITELKKQMADTQTDLKMLLRMNDQRFILPSDGFTVLEQGQDITIDQLLNSGRQNNPYYQMQQSQVLLQQQNLQYQKALKSPDITVGPEYDRNSNYMPKYFGLSVSLPLNIFNRNQGNIKSAAMTVRAQEALTMQTSLELDNQLINAYNKWLLFRQQQSGIQKDFYEKYTRLFNKMTESYQQKQVGLLEFLDFFNNYQDAGLRLAQQQFNLQLAAAELNFFTGTDLIKL